MINLPFCPPKSSGNFENLVMDCLNADEDATFNKYGCSGQSQNGIDLYDAVNKVVCQCKNYHGNKLKKSTIISDIERAQEAFPDMKEMIIATTASPDTAVDKAIMQLTIPIRMLYWDHFSRILHCHKDIAKKYYADIPDDTEDTKQLINHFLAICNKYELFTILADSNMEILLKNNTVDCIECELNSLLQSSVSIKANKAVLRDIHYFTQLYSTMMMQMSMLYTYENNNEVIPLDNSVKKEDYILPYQNNLYDILYKYKFMD